ncbi:MAG: copper amine oxidase N-terminal domain-containing protein [Peptococcaceae bacterium]|nr:copper amine oxidase N-terminal domain-containing protein [Peptococcaceae bacterium]
MNRRALKALCIGLVLLFSLSIFAGCSRDEIGFYTMLKAQSTMKGSVEVSSNVKLEITADDPEWQEMVGSSDMAQALSGMQIVVTEKANLDDMSEEMNVTLIIGKQETNIGTIKLVDGVLYFNNKEMLKALKGVLPLETYNAIEKAGQGKEWVSVDMMEFALDRSNPLAGNYSEESRLILNTYFDFMDTFFLQGYRNYSSGLVSKTGDTYQLTLTDKDLAEFIRSAGLYSVANIKDVGSALKSFINSTSAEGRELLFGTTGISTAEIDDLIRETVETKGELNELINEVSALIDENFLPLIKGSKYVQTIEGTENGYLNTIDMNLAINDKNGDNVINILLKGASSTKRISTVKITAPEDVISWADMKKDMPSSKGIRIFNDKSYVMNEKIELGITSIPQDHKFGFMSDLLEKDGYRYYPLRQIGEALGQEVGWSDSAQTAYVVNAEGARVSFTGIEKDGTMYIKIRDFEKIGYKVEWDETAQSMYIYR